MGVLEQTVNRKTRDFKEWEKRKKSGLLGYNSQSWRCTQCLWNMCYR